MSLMQTVERIQLCIASTTGDLKLPGASVCKTDSYFIHGKRCIHQEQKQVSQSKDEALLTHVQHGFTSAEASICPKSVFDLHYSVFSPVLIKQLFHKNTVCAGNTASPTAC